jgi:lipid-binding SYLF domain-containing protein
MRFRNVALLSFVLLSAPIGGSSTNAVLAQEPSGTTDEARRVSDATAILTRVMSADGQTIPPAVLEKAVGIAVLPYAPAPRSQRGQGPNQRRLSLMHGIRARGIMSVRSESGDWSAPAFVTLNGGGRPMGDLVFIMMSRPAVHRVLGSAFQFESNAAPGPVGLESMAAAGAPAVDMVTYSLTRGTLAGITLDASMFVHDNDSTSRFYGTRTTGSQAVARTSGPEPVAAWQAALEKHAPK